MLCIFHGHNLIFSRERKKEETHLKPKSKKKKVKQNKYMPFWLQILAAYLSEGFLLRSAKLHEIHLSKTVTHSTSLMVH